jgi:putative phage-type endonuclease
MKNRKAWLQERKKGIGGSDVAAILGIDSFRTPVMVYEDKNSLEIDDQDNKPNDPKTALMYWGTVFEDDILDAYEEVTGCKVERDMENMEVNAKKIYRENVFVGLIAHPTKPWLLASLDGMAVIDGEQVIVEAKNIEWDRNGEWGESETDVIAPRYMCQVQHYLNVTGLKKAHVAARISGILKVYKINRDDALIADIEEELRYFWFEKLGKRVPPEPINMGDIKILYPKSKKETVKARPEHISIVDEINNLNELIYASKKQLEEKKEIIAKHMCANEVLETEDGRALVEYPTDKRGVRTMRIVKKQG